MALQKPQLIGITSVVGIHTVGIFTVGVTNTTGGVGIASTSFIRSVVMHNTGLGTARVGLYLNNTTTPITGTAATNRRFLQVDVAPNETTFFETNYPIVMKDRDSLSVTVEAPDAGGSGIGSMINFIVNGDTEANP